MKKTLLSVLAGLIVIGSASAVPGPDDRKKLCDQHPDKFVWVEKTQACIPINPCAYGVNENIAEAYCLDKVFITLPKEVDKRTMILERYVTNVLKTSIVTTNLLYDCPEEDVGKYCSNALAIKTSDGGYFAASYSDTWSVTPAYENWEGEARSYARAYAGECYGYRFMYMDHSDDMSAKVSNKAECEDIADFASVLLGDIVNYEFKTDTQECILKKG